MKAGTKGLRDLGTRRALAPARCWLLVALFALGLTISATLQAQQAAPTQPGFIVSGTVVDALSGDPLSGVTLTLTPQRGNEVLDQTRSGEDGSFHLTAPSAGKFQLRATRRGYTPSLYEQHGDFNSAVVTGPDQDTSRIVFRLPPQAVLHGTVTADFGEPAGGATVMLFRKPGKEDPTGRILRTSTTSTDDTGSYEFANLRPSEYLIAVSARPWYALHPHNGQPSELDVAFPVTYYDSTTEETSATSVRLAVGSSTEANISLHALPALHIAIAGTGTRNGRKPDEFRPAGLAQRIFGNTVDALGDWSQNDETAGNTEIDGIAPGHYELSVGDPLSGERSHRVALDATASSTIDPDAGVPSANVSALLLTAPGQPLTHYAVMHLIPDDGNQTEAACDLGEKESDPGELVCQEIPTGRWTVKVDNGYGNALRVLSVSSGGRSLPGNRIAVSGQPIKLTVLVQEGAATLEGFAKKDGKPLAGVLVVLVPKDLKNHPTLARRDQTDSDGSFSLLNVFPGNYTVVTLEDAWELDWGNPEVIARYLPGGQSVTLPAASAGSIRLDASVAVQSR